MNASMRVENHQKARFRISTCSRRIFRLAAFSILLLSLSFEAPAAVQEPADKSGSAAAAVRPCPTDPKLTRKDKKRGKRAAAASDEVPPACLEARASALDIQEFFQSFVREQNWQVGEEKIAEDTLTFFRYLDKDELLSFSNAGPFAGRVTWTEGKAFVRISTLAIKEGFTRVQVSARFQGHGQNVDRFAPPKDSWELESNGTLEKNLISALELHLKSLH